MMRVIVLVFGLATFFANATTLLLVSIVAGGLLEIS